MNYSAGEIMQYIAEEDVKFIRLAFCDIYGRQKNISIMPHELERAFETGISFDASAIAGFNDDVHSDLLLFPDPASITVLPWRPEHGRVVRMFCDIAYPDGHRHMSDSRQLLRRAIQTAEDAGYSFSFGSELEFYLFKTDDAGASTKEPHDLAGYMDIAPDDKGENVRREVCLTLEQMGILPESSHHEEGPGQNEIDFRYAAPLTAADHAANFCTAVRTIAARNGLYADFSPKPLSDRPGSGHHINISVRSPAGEDVLPYAMAGILEQIADITVFLNPVADSYKRLGRLKAPGYIAWSRENRSQLIRIPAAEGDYRRLELRSPDPMANPYLAFTLLIYAALDGVQRRLAPPPPADFNFYTASEAVRAAYRHLPQSLEDAGFRARNSPFVKAHLSDSIISAYCP